MKNIAHFALLLKRPDHASLHPPSFLPLVQE